MSYFEPITIWYPGRDKTLAEIGSGVRSVDGGYFCRRIFSRLLGVASNRSLYRSVSIRVFDRRSVVLSSNQSNQLEGSNVQRSTISPVLNVCQRLVILEFGYIHHFVDRDNKYSEISSSTTSPSWFQRQSQLAPESARHLWGDVPALLAHLNFIEAPLRYGHRGTWQLSGTIELDICCTLFRN
jgi:hypothetical protein